MIRSPTLAWLPSASATSGVGGWASVGEAVGAGAVVEFGDKVAGGGEHDRVEPVAAVVLPGGEHVLGDGGEVADVDPVVVEVEPERLGLAVAEGEGGGGFGRIGEPQQLGEPDRPVVASMSRRTPPAPIAASCWSSPISRTLPPRSTM